MINSAKTKPYQPSLAGLDELIQTALAEDIGSGDVTTDSIVPEKMQSRACWKAKQEGVIAGLFVGEKVFRALDEEIRWKPQVEEGAEVKVDDILVEIEGQSRTLLISERTALNFVQRLSGIATKTRRFVKKLEGTGTQILDTRKTLPGFRTLDKYAVKAGGGVNHRMGLYDMALIKENHIAVAGGIAQAVERVRSAEAKVEVETTNLGQVKEAVAVGAEMIMLDNMSNKEMKEVVTWINSRAVTEASGNITVERLEEIAETGVDYISAGALTHSVEAFDISQLIYTQ